MKLLVIFGTLLAIATAAPAETSAGAPAPVDNVKPVVDEGANGFANMDCGRCNNHYQQCYNNTPWYLIPWRHTICEGDTCNFERCKAECGWKGC
ncbi:hypothetical protein BDV95DRAFT_601932 [Massariosphaeria phaeospora]|uniref:Uncharacterized protein n=1 Tax=Massariosphaeria phaeospora TaxID=100035 RepID=A0A7C8IHU2_9PLEO|nr:hypothetical protein BDV95DRAFT_601932 [Massariosphaeria phaeospora]